MPASPKAKTHQFTTQLGPLPRGSIVGHGRLPVTQFRLSEAVVRAKANPQTKTKTLALHGLARILSKLGYCSRSEATGLILLGRVALNGRICRNPDQPAAAERDVIMVDGNVVQQEQKAYLLINKPRGQLITSFDEKTRQTTFSLLASVKSDLHENGAPGLSLKRRQTALNQFRLPGQLVPVGRSDQSSEGLLLFTNDHAWADRVMTPTAKVLRTYQIQVSQAVEATVCQRLETGVTNDGEAMAANKANLMRQSGQQTWLEITMEEGRNRSIRRLLTAFQLGAARLICTAVGPIELGSITKGQWRHLTAKEVAAFYTSPPAAKVPEPIPSVQVPPAVAGKQKRRAPEGAPWNS